MEYAYTSKADMVTAALRELIITGALKPGDRLRQRELAERFDVSATPVREALRRLQAEGLVTDQLHRGCSVVERGFGASHENYEIRAALEPMAARLAAERISDQELEELRSIQEEFTACEQGDPRVNWLNREFHMRIYSSAESPMIVSLLRLLWQAFPEGPQMIRPHRESVEQHNQLLQALADHDGEAAAELTRAHILGVLDYLGEPATRAAAGRS